MNKKYCFYTNGIKTIRVYDGDIIPDGYWKGRTFKVNTWNKGLTKDDPRVAYNLRNSKATQFTSESVPWNKGLTKDTDERMLDIANKVSISTKGRTSWNKGVPMSDETKKKLSLVKINLFKDGLIIWNKGLTKYTSESIRRTSEKLSGRHVVGIDWETAKKKEYETKKKNHSFNTSKPEQILKEQLIMFFKDDVIYQFRDKERYPFNCDFYIKSLDLFIELNFYWTHGGHPFDPNNQDDLDKLNKWMEKAKIKKQYNSAISVWTKKDVQKYNTAVKNNLRYVRIYTSKELDTFILNLENLVNFWEIPTKWDYQKPSHKFMEGLTTIEMTSK